MEDQRDLIKCVRKYRNYDDELKQLNAKANELREKRKLVELEMGDILRRNNFSQIHKLDIADDKSMIKIQRPDQWSKPWSLSAKDLGAYIKQYFSSTKTPNADDCTKFIITHRKDDLISHDFSFSRILHIEDNDQDGAVA